MEDDYKYVLTSDERELQDELVVESINPKVIHIRSVSGTPDGEIITQIYTCKYRDDEADFTDMNSCATAFLSTTFPKWCKDNNIHLIYGDMVLRVFLGGKEEFFLDKYIKDAQGETLEDTVTNLELLRRITRLSYE